MPDVKRNFTGGKMNKDLDERLIPNGEYRDAMNIQVSTSEGSDVGAIENILGTQGFSLPIVTLRPNGETQPYHCVGSVIDEKNDASYWFLSGEKIPVPGPSGPGSNSPAHAAANDIFIVRDYIVKNHKVDAATYAASNQLHQQSIIFTDYKSILTRTILPSAINPITGIQGQVINPVLKQIYLPPGFANNISVGDTLLSIIDIEGNVSTQNSKVTVVNDQISTGHYIQIDEFNDSSFLSFNTNNYLALEFTSGNLMFEEDHLITGINIIDDLLFWTDNENEPKVININRCEAGTNPNGTDPTFLINNNLSPGAYLRKIFPKDIQVIKRKPTKKLTVDFTKSSRSGFVKGFTEYKFSNSSSNLFSPGYEDQLNANSMGNVTNPLNYQEGDVLVLLNETDATSGSRILPYEYDVKIVIKNIGSIPSFPGTNVIDYEIISIGSDTPSSQVGFHIELEQELSTLFEEEMMRFSYRYRYLDKEVSPFAPFTNPIFSPTEFKYEAKDAYNLGMVNTITDLKLKDFVDVENTLGIESVDLLVKYEGSPLVYIVDTIDRKDFEIYTDMDESPYTGEYDFNPKNIRGVLPENQMLRPWDAVPKAAKSQEIVGNRIVYGNYLFSYNFSLSDFDLNVKTLNRPLLDISQNLTGAPSVKSKRDYQVGIVLLDEEGRESPVFSTSDSYINIPKSYSNSNTMLSITNNCNMPYWAKSYKYYVKDSSLPAYNVVVDSFYKAKNGDFWIAVPSSERNKVEEGEFLELKKGINSNKSVGINLDTKIISIENEAPDFIKTKYRSLGSCRAEFTDAAGNSFSLFESSAQPRYNKTTTL